MRGTLQRSKENHGKGAAAGKGEERCWTETQELEVGGAAQHGGLHTRCGSGARFGVPLCG